MTTVRAKFKVHSVVLQSYGGEPLRTVKMVPVSSGSEENKKFFKWTPTGAIDLGTINEEAAKAFELDGEYYVDFTKAD